MHGSRKGLHDPDPILSRSVGRQQRQIPIMCRYPYRSRRRQLPTRAWLAIMECLQPAGQCNSRTSWRIFLRPPGTSSED